MLGLISAAIQPGSGSTLIDTLLAPVGGVGVVVGGVYLVFKEYRNAREINVKAARERQEQAEKDLEEARSEREEDMRGLREEINRLREQVQPLEQKINDLNRSIRETDERHTRELTERERAHREEINRMNERTLKLVQTGWILRTTLAEAGIPLPDAINEANPTPQLDLGVNLDDDGTDGAL